MPWSLAGDFANFPLNSSTVKVDVVWPGAAVAKSVDGLKPPWNQPHERPAVFSSSPMFWPDMATASRVEQSSQYGWASLVSEKPPLPSAVMSAFGFAAVAWLG